MKYAYLGDHASVDLYGVHFPVGVFVEVTNPILLRKLAGNNHFAAEPTEHIADNAPVEIESAPRRGRPPKAK